HLKSCWSCRARQAQLQDQIRALADSFADPDYPSSSWSSDAKQRFRRWQSDFERQPFQAVPAGPGARPWAIRILAFTAASLAVLGFLAWRNVRSNPATAPAAVIALVRQSDAQLRKATFHQSFRVDIAQNRPMRDRRSGRLDVWSDVASAHFVSRWFEGDEIKHEVIRNAAMVRTRPASSSIIQSANDIQDLDGLGRAFLVWLESRTWEAVSFADDVAAFLSEDGVAAKVEQVKDERGQSFLRLTTVRHRDRATVELTMEMAAGSYQARIQRIRLETAERSLE